MWSVFQNLYTEVSVLNRSFGRLHFTIVGSLTLVAPVNTSVNTELARMIQMEKYVPPDWALGLSYIPSTYIKVVWTCNPM